MQEPEEPEDEDDSDDENYIEDSCVAMLSFGPWIEKSCLERLPFICYEGRSQTVWVHRCRYLLIYHTNKILQLKLRPRLMLPFRNLEVQLQPDAVSTLGVSKLSAASSGREDR